ncbi:hypothetical protein RBB50_009459 [Rhinocladiella similis]
MDPEHGRSSLNEKETAEDIQVSRVEATPPYDAERHRLLRRKIDRHLMPICFWVYLINYLDRSNIGNAKILNSETGDSLLQSLNMSPNGYAVTVTLFAIAYSIFDVPANIVLKRFFRPSLWFGSLFFLWGVLTLASGFQKTYPSAVVIRFFIGALEAGFYPGIVYYITFWYRQEERSFRIAFFSAGTTLSGAFGGCLAYGVALINRRAGLKGWQWLFVIEGLITILSTTLLFFLLPDYPSTSKWLEPEEKQFAIDRLDEQQSSFTREHASRHEILEALSPRMIAHYLAFFLDVVVFSSLVYFCPTIVNGLGYTSIHAQLMTVPAWSIGFVVSLVVAYSGDKLNARGYHAAFTATLGGVGFLACAVLPAHAYKARYGCLLLASCGAFPTLAPLAGWVTCNAPGQRTVGLCAALNSAGVGLASVVSVWIWRAQEAPRGYPTGNKVCAVCSFVSALLAICLRLHYGRLNQKAAASGDSNARVWVY